ncbi:extracellular solute-binding protein [Cohnella zeiphila]|uniref:Extracellular solute-binding protein n=1 Tax=Cohnella zeiphila TaxID=2761120 RepID=A0A7X0SPQ8_9BACL|nr:extracellular solute-binding protein [Cohnella zeiphila]MBB6732749.1 extracellular solute-binding protein [Cohnella zeiphila]
MKIRKSSKVMLIVMLLMVVFTAACSNNGAQSSNNGAQASSTNSSSTQSNSQTADDKPSGQPVKISFFASPSALVADLNTNKFTQYVENEFNMKIDWMTVPQSDISTKQSLLMASGDYPEVFWNGSFDTSDILKYSQQGILVPLNDLIKEYAPNIQEALDTIPGIKEISTAPDGNIYGLPQYNYCLHCYYAAKLWLNTKLLDEYGLQMPTTPEEFEHVLQVFKDKQGKDFIPLTGSTDGWHSNPVVFLMNAFAYDNDDNYFDVEDGKVSFSPSSPEWRKGLEYIHELYAKGLIDPQFLSQKDDVLKRNLAQNKVGVFAAGGSNNELEGGDMHPDFQYWRTVPPLKGPDGLQEAAFFGNQPTSLTFVMTKKSTKEQQIAMMKFLNFVWSPLGTEMLQFGPEGEYWKKAQPGELGLNGQQSLYTDKGDSKTGFYSGGTKQNEGWDAMGPMYGSELLRNLSIVAVPPLQPGGSQTTLHLETLLNYVGHQPAQVYPGVVWVPVDQVQQYAVYKTNIKKYVDEWTASFIAGNKSLDKDWDAYIKGLDNLGLNDYLKMSQDSMGKPFDTSAFKPDQDALNYLLSLK